MSNSDDIEAARYQALYREAPLAVWEEAVARSYRAMASKEEFDGKATVAAVRKIATYLRGTDCGIEQLDGEQDEGPNCLVYTLFDFISYTEDPVECIHPGVFARDRAFEYCHTCETDIPRQHL
jgi:hypothetical protein